MKNLRSIINEGDEKLLKQTLKNHDQKNVEGLRQRYYGVADHLQSLVKELTKLKAGTGYFGDDLKNAKTALDAFNKISLGKYL